MIGELRCCCWRLDYFCLHWFFHWDKKCLLEVCSESSTQAFTLKIWIFFKKMPVDANQEQKSMFAPGWCFNCAKPPASDKTASLSPSFFSEGASFTTFVSSPSVVVHANRLQRNSIHDRGVYPQSLQRGQRSFTDCLARWWTNAFSRKGVEQFVNVRQNFEKGL